MWPGVGNGCQILLTAEESLPRKDLWMSKRSVSEGTPREDHWISKRSYRQHGGLCLR